MLSRMPGRDRVHEQRRSAEAHEGQRQPLRRQDGQRHREVHERLHAEHRRQAEGEERPEVVRGPQRRANAARDEQEVHAAEGGDADEPELLADDRGDEVGVRLGQVQRLEAAPDAEPRSGRPSRRT